MLKILSYILRNGLATVAEPCPPLEADANGMPAITDKPCSGSGCNACAVACPTEAIVVVDENGKGKIALDLGACIGCQLCIDVCPTGTIVNDRSTKLARIKRSDLVLTNDLFVEQEMVNGVDQVTKKGQIKSVAQSEMIEPQPDLVKNLFGRSLHARVVSTGCSACDMEISACGNPVFDLERFGVQIVASPRFADVLLVTGPVGRGMRDSLLRCYAAMPDPKIVVAVGTCAISGGVHKNGYAEANGVDKFLPVAMHIPGCPPHPWTIIHGILLAMGKIKQ